MSQKQLTIVPFRSTDWNKLKVSLDHDPVHAHLSDPRSGVGILRGAQVRVVPVNNLHEEERIVEIVEAQGFMVQGRVPKPYILLEFRPVKKKQPDERGLKHDVTDRGRLKSYWWDKNHIYAHEDFDEQVIALIQQKNYELVRTVHYSQD